MKPQGGYAISAKSWSRSGTLPGPVACRYSSLGTLGDTMPTRLAAILKEEFTPAQLGSRLAGGLNHEQAKRILDDLNMHYKLPTRKKLKLTKGGEISNSLGSEKADLSSEGAFGQQIADLVKKGNKFAAKGDDAPFSEGDILLGEAAGRGTSSHVFFYQVISATAKSVTFREIEKKIKSQHDDGSSFVPVKGKFEGKATRKKIQTDSGKPSVDVGRGISASLWNGKPARSTRDPGA